MEKYLFLDIDGVIRVYSYDAYLVANRKKQRDKHGPFFDPKCVALLNELLLH